ncbi:MAG: hypothetical protein M9941_03770 [Anaerolineae bacterium]|nr:hypothetical protein [Anaerolineae bacterium]
MTEDNPIILLAGETDEDLVPLRSQVDFGRAPQSAVILVNYIGSWDSQARNAFDYAVSIWETQITSNVPILVNAEWAALSPGILGGAGPYYNIRNFSGAPRTNTWYPAALANSLAGYDLNSSLPDIAATFNSAFSSWYFGTDGNAPSNTYDFVTVVLHELGHGLGFTGTMEIDDGIFSNSAECFGTAGYGCWGYFNGQPTGSPAIYDTLTENGSGQDLITFQNPSFTLAAQLQSNSVYFLGANAQAANGGTRPRLFAPTQWINGSSYAHLDESAFPQGTANALMTPYLNNGEVLHSPGAVTIGIFRDVGWNVSSAPELEPLPSFMLLIGDSIVPAIDLWQYVDDPDTGDDQLTFSMQTTDVLAGVSIRNNRYIDIEPIPDFPLQAEITITVADPQGNTDSQKFSVFVVREIFSNHLPMVIAGDS